MIVQDSRSPRPEILYTPEQHVHHTSALRPLPFPLDCLPLSHPPSFPPSPSSLSKICNAGIKYATYVKAQPLFYGLLPLRDIDAHLAYFPNSRTTAREEYNHLSRRKPHRLIRRGTHTPAHNVREQFGICHPGRNTNVIRVSLL